VRHIPSLSREVLPILHTPKVISILEPYLAVVPRTLLVTHREILETLIDSASNLDFVSGVVRCISYELTEINCEGLLGTLS
jgi:hypothetical protein